jgi:IS1 family transposase
MNKLNMAKRAAVVAALVEGNSIRAACRMTNVCKPAVLKLLADLGRACADYHDEHVYDLATRRVQADEVWSFCAAKQKNVPADKRGVFGYGDLWLWTAIDADSKMIVSYLVGDRSQRSAYAFMYDLAHRLRNRIQLTTDAHSAYLAAVQVSFEGRAIDYAMMQKVYGEIPGERRYSPGKIVSTHTEVIKGIPDPRHISTSYVERQNLTLRMQNRRYTRLTNAFSKKAENHIASVHLHYLHYNFARVHQTLRVTPAVAAGIADHVWSIEEIVGLLDAAEKKAA